MMHCNNKYTIRGSYRYLTSVWCRHAQAIDYIVAVAHLELLCVPAHVVAVRVVAAVRRDHRARAAARPRASRLPRHHLRHVPRAAPREGTALLASASARALSSAALERQAARLAASLTCYSPLCRLRRRCAPTTAWQASRGAAVPTAPATCS